MLRREVIKWKRSKNTSFYFDFTRSAELIVLFYFQNNKTHSYWDIAKYLLDKRKLLKSIIIFLKKKNKFLTSGQFTSKR